MAAWVRRSLDGSSAMKEVEVSWREAKVKLSRVRRNEKFDLRWRRVQKGKVAGSNDPRQ